MEFDCRLFRLIFFNFGGFQSFLLALWVIVFVDDHIALSSVSFLVFLGFWVFGFVELDSSIIRTDFLPFLKVSASSAGV